MPVFVQNDARELSLNADMVIGGLSCALVMLCFVYGVKFRVHAAVITFGVFSLLVGKLLVHLSASFCSPHEQYVIELCLDSLYIIFLLTWCVVLWLNEPACPIADRMQTLLWLGGKHDQKISRSYEPADPRAR
jgi:hypothetical protein